MLMETYHIVCRNGDWFKMTFDLLKGWDGSGCGEFEDSGKDTSYYESCLVGRGSYEWRECLIPELKEGMDVLKILDDKGFNYREAYNIEVGDEITFIDGIHNKKIVEIDSTPEEFFSIIERIRVEGLTAHKMPVAVIEQYDKNGIFYGSFVAQYDKNGEFYAIGHENPVLGKDDVRSVKLRSFSHTNIEKATSAILEFNDSQKAIVSIGALHLDAFALADLVKIFTRKE